MTSMLANDARVEDLRSMIDGLLKETDTYGQPAGPVARGRGPVDDDLHAEGELQQRAGRLLDARAHDAAGFARAAVERLGELFDGGGREPGHGRVLRTEAHDALGFCADDRSLLLLLRLLFLRARQRDWAISRWDGGHKQPLQYVKV